MPQLNELSKAQISKTIGLPYDELEKMGAEAIDRQIEKKIGKKLKFMCMSNILYRPLELKEIRLPFSYKIHVYLKRVIGNLR